MSEDLVIDYFESKNVQILVIYCVSEMQLMQ